MPPQGSHDVPSWAEPTDDTDLAAVYAELLALVSTSPQLDRFLDGVVQLAASILTPAAAASLTAERDGRWETAASTSPLANGADELQYRLGDGPCLDCLQSGQTVEIGDMSADDRWPEFAEQCVDAGVLSTLSVPLVVHDSPVGALNLYAASAHAFADGHRARMRAFASFASGAFTLLQDRVSDARLTAELQEALASRSVIDQALGVLMTQRRLDADEAFTLLRDTSSRSNRKVRDLAAEIVEQASGKPLVRPPQFRRQPTRRPQRG